MELIKIFKKKKMEIIKILTFLNKLVTILIKLITRHKMFLIQLKTVAIVVIAQIKH
jgi:hypothetical protein